jgi:hypothetical protein
VTEFVVTAGGERLDFTSLELTLSDPGGCETCTVQLPEGVATPPDAPLSVFDGARGLWVGTVEEPGQRGRTDAAVAAVGEGAKSKRNPFSMVYLDRLLSEWKSTNSKRRLQLEALSRRVIGPQVADDAAAPTLRLEVDGAWPTTARPLVEALYDAGPGNTIAYVAGNWARSGPNKPSEADANWHWAVGLLTKSPEVGGLVTDTGNLRAAGPGSIRLAPSYFGGERNWRYAYMSLSYAVGPAGEDGARYAIDWTDLIVVGPHGLPVRGGGLLASDVARDAFRRTRAGWDLDVADSASVLLQQLVYRTPTQPEKVVADMARLCGWHWGVWPGSSLAGAPVAVFRPPPEQATAVVHFRDCSEPDLTEKASAMHDACRVTYTTPAGGGGIETVTKPHPRVGAVGNVLEADAGIVASAAVAQTIAAYLLALDQSSSRVAGSMILPDEVLLPSGGRIPSHWLRPGRDRLRIVGLPTTGSLIDDGAARVDSFRVKRLGLQVIDGRPRVRCEFDAGADLIETLTARLELAAVTAQVG